MSGQHLIPKFWFNVLHVPHIQIFYYAPKMSESWKGQKLLSRAEFHVGVHVTKFLRLQILPASSDRTSATQGLIKPIGLLYCLVPWMIALVVLHLLMNSPFVGFSHYRKSLLMLFPMLLESTQDLSIISRSNGKAHRPGRDT